LCRRDRSEAAYQIDHKRVRHGLADVVVEQRHNGQGVLAEGVLEPPAPSGQTIDGGGRRRPVRGRRAQAIDTQLRKTRAAGRKRFNEVLNDPKGYKTRAPSLPPSAEPTPTAIIDDAKERARQIIQEAEKRAHKILAEAARSRAQTAATPSAGNPSQPVKETIQLMPLNLNPEGPSEPMIGWIRHDLRRGSQ